MHIYFLHFSKYMWSYVPKRFSFLFLLHASMDCVWPTHHSWSIYISLNNLFQNISGAISLDIHFLILLYGNNSNENPFTVKLASSSLCEYKRKTLPKLHGQQESSFAAKIKGGSTPPIQKIICDKRFCYFCSKYTTKTEISVTFHEVSDCNSQVQ